LLAQDAWQAIGFPVRSRRHSPFAGKRIIELISEAKKTSTIPFREWALLMTWWHLRGQALWRIGAALLRRRAVPTFGQPALPGVDCASPPPPRIPVKLNEVTCFAPQSVGHNPDIWPESQPLVSVIVVSFNYGHFVEEAVDSVLAQTFQDLEIILVEGGSTSRESYESVANLVRPKTRVLYQQSPTLIGANRNFGISHARGKYVCCLDADDRFRPTYIEKAVFLMEHYGYDVVSSALEFFGSRVVPQPRRRKRPPGILEKPRLADLLEANNVTTCALYRRSLWERAGGFRDTDDKVTGYVFEDWCFWVRLAALGARFINMREQLFLYRNHGLGSSERPDVLPLDQQATIIRKINSDVLETPINSSLGEDHREPDGLRNLGTRARSTVDKRPVILFAMPFLCIGGTERLLSAVAAHLGSLGWRIVVVTTVMPDAQLGDSTDWFQETTNEIYHLPRFLASDRWNDFVHYLFRTRNVSTILIAGSAYCYHFLPEIRKAHPHVTVADLLLNPVAHTGNNRQYAEHIDLNFVENNEVREWLLNSGETADRIELIESGVDLQSFAPGARDPQVMAGLGVSERTLIVGFFGRWSKEKDPLGFISIAQRVPPECPVSFVMAGTGVLRPSIEAAVQQAHFPEGRFYLVGLVSDVSAYLRSCDIVVIPSKLDGRPQSAMEALAVGVPVVASRVGGLAALIEDDLNGYLCDPGDYEGFAARITSLAFSSSKLTQMKYAARSFAERNLDKQRMLSRYVAAFNNLRRAAAESHQAKS
jgi:glycosyltransferase involved in cell wall biosynthesis